MTVAAVIMALGAAHIGTVAFTGVMVANGYALYHYLKGKL